MIPFHDENATQRTPYVTFVLIGLNVLAWLLIQGAGATIPLARSVCVLGLIPGELTASVPPGTRFPMGPGIECLTDPGLQIQNLLTSMFMHGSWMHLIGNMWFLWLFGNNIEDSMTRPRFIAFYLICGLAAALAQVIANPSSTVPMVGASGAISGVMGAYLILFPHVRVFTLVPLGFYLTTIALPAWAMLIYWVVLQIFGGFTSVAAGQEGGVAFWAHLGGFLAGVALVKLFEIPDRLAAHKSHHYRPRRVGWRR